MLKFISWNVNGWRAIERKAALEPVLELGADIYCFQEIKTSEPELNLRVVAEFEMEFCSAEKKGYSGTMNLVSRKLLEGEQKEPEKQKGRNEKVGQAAQNKREVIFLKKDELFREEILKKEGRICPIQIGAKNNSNEEKSGSSPLLLLNVYFPNGGMSEERLRYKMNFYEAFGREMKRLRETKKWAGIVICGDVNTAHEEIDLARPKENSKNTGFLPMEREWVTKFLKSGFIDTYRAEHPVQEKAYTWWDYKTFARERNVGWRIDYFFVSDNLRKLIKKTAIESEIRGSDHAPITLEIDF